MRFYLLCLTGFLFAATLLFSQSPIKTEDSLPKFCDSIYIDSVIVLESEQLLTYLSFNFRNEGIVLSAYPILSCTLESNPYYGTNENDLEVLAQRGQQIVGIGLDLQLHLGLQRGADAAGATHLFQHA